MDQQPSDDTEITLSLEDTTSPSQLQELSALEVETTMGIKSPQGTMKLRSIKDYEEQLTALKKDNFNLKLRIYFLEERMGTNNIIDRDSIIKENIELKVEKKTLCTELEDKQELLVQAVKAMELEEMEHKKIVSHKEQEITNLVQQMQIMQEKMQTIANHAQTMKNKSASFEMEDSVALYTAAFGLQGESSQVAELKQRISELQAQLTEEQELTSKLENEMQQMECISQRCENLESELDQRDEKIRSLMRDLEEKGHMSSSLNLRIRGLEEELSHRNNEIEYKIKEVKKRDNVIHEQTFEIDELRRMLGEAQIICEKEQRQVESLKGTVMARNNCISELETRLEKTKTVIRKLEAKLEATTNEVKRYHDEIETLRRRSKNTNNDSDSISARTKSTGSLSLSPTPSPQKIRLKAASPPKTPRSVSQMSVPNSPQITSSRPSPSASLDENKFNLQTKVGHLQSENEELKEQVKKLKQMDKENKDAMKIANGLLSMRNKLEMEKQELEELLKQKEDIILDLTKNIVSNQSVPAAIATEGGDGSMVKESLSNKSLQDKVSELNLTATPPKKDNELSSSIAEQEDRELIEKYKELVSELKQQIEVYVALIAEKDEQIKNLQVEVLAAGDTLNEKDNKIRDLGDEINTLRNNIASAVANFEHSESSEMSGNEKQDVGSEKCPEVLAKQVAEKEQEIERLEMDLRKKNSDLQGLVNKELWEKNREIERMQNRYTALIETKDVEISALQKSLNGRNFELHILMDKILELDFRHRIQVDSPPVSRMEVNENNIITIIDTIKEDLLTLQSEHERLLLKLPADIHEKSISQIELEYKDLQQQFEKSEKLRHETTDICAVMTSRLEELALFLDSLLKHKSVLGFLGSEQKTSLRHLIDQSLDLSKTLALSISLNPDQSLMQLSNISNILNNSKVQDFSFSDLSACIKNEENSILKLEPESATLVYTNYLKAKSSNSNSNRDEYILKLQDQIETLKKKVQVDGVDLGHQNIVSSSSENSKKYDEACVKLSPTKVLPNPTMVALKTPAYENSESESWSEPDRSVSQARIGLVDESFRNSITSVASLNRSKNRYALSPDKSTESTEEDAEIMSGSKALRRESRYLITMLQEKISQLESTLQEKDTELLQAQCTFFELDNELKREKIELEKLTQRIMLSDENLKKVVEEKTKAEETIATLEVAYKDMQNTKAELEMSVKTSEVKINELVKENDDANKAMEVMKDKHSQEIEMKLREIDEKWANKLKKIEAEAEVRVKEIQDATNELKLAYERDWIRKSDVEKKLVETEIVFRELEGLKNVVKCAEKKMSEMEANEKEMKAKLHENEKLFREKNNVLRKELDAAIQATSEAVLERTRIANEKIKLEQELRKFDLKENELIKQVNEFEVEFSSTTHNYKKQLSNLEHQKSQLELRVSELEATNADLLNRFLKSQEQQTAITSDSWHPSGGNSLPSSPNVKAVQCIYKRQCSDLSGYTSEEIPVENDSAWYKNNQLVATTNANLEDHPPGRHVVNSSPDLGIESDQGRFSSLEVNVSASRPLLQTLELTQSMTNLLAVANRSLDFSKTSNADCVCDHKALEEENIELKKRLLRTRRALEETVSQLALANQRKKLVERAVCKQIHKTSQVLRKAKANLDSGSETDHLKK